MKFNRLKRPNLARGGQKVALKVLVCAIKAIYDSHLFKLDQPELSFVDSLLCLLAGLYRLRLASRHDHPNTRPQMDELFWALA